MENSEIQEQLEAIEDLRNKIENYIRLRLGDQIIDIEPDKEHFDMAIQNAIIKYRQKSSNSVEESYAFLNLMKHQQDYILPQEVMEVRQVIRRGVGTTSGITATQFEPFSSGYLNTYMLVAGRVGGLTNYEMFSQYQKLTMRMFGGYMNHRFNRVTKKLTIDRKIPEDGETVLLWLYNYKPDQILLSDIMSFPWIQEYAYALVKYTVGESREKFVSIPGPQGGTSLNGSALKTEAQALMDKLELELQNYADGAQPLTWIIG